MLAPIDSNGKDGGTCRGEPSSKDAKRRQNHPSYELLRWNLVLRAALLSSKSVMPKLKPLAVVALIAIVGICCLLLWRSAKPQPTPFPLAVPASANLLHSFRHVGGINEKTYAFAFEVTDQSLMDQLISEWSLRDCSTDRFPGSFASMIAAYWEISWWPDRPTLEAIPIRYGVTDTTKQTYRTLYFDDVSDRLYVEYGNW